MRTIRYPVLPEQAGWTVEQLLRREGFSSRMLTALRKLPRGLLLEGEHIRTVDPLSPGQVLEVNLPEEEKRIPPCEIPVPILYEDEDVILYNKPAGMPCHQSGGHIYGTLSSVYAAHCAKTGTVTPFRAINRLDKDTTGAVVAAKNQFAAGKLWKAVRKRYFALVEGALPFPAGLIDLPILRERPLEMRRVVDPEGQEAKTEFHLLAQGDGVSLVGLVLHTGRTHQIRVHFSHLGLPLAGDLFYGGQEEPGLSHQALHCGQVTFPHVITGEQVTVAAPFPTGFLEVMARRGIPWREGLTDFSPAEDPAALPLFLRPCP
ncbi:MAG: RluA family pseudouridine synthase [Angelakisella sp.]|jgi:23S rRNA pseudouridine1911/1915/1917 synthase|nr:RluA family pseudouridine synthase [Angelakisella sp.]